MNKINNNKLIVLSLGILAILVFGTMLIPAQSYARSCGLGGCNYNYNSFSGYNDKNVPNEQPTDYNYNTSSTPVYVPVTTTKVVYAKPAPAPIPVVYSNTDTTKKPDPVVYSNTDNTPSDLAANSVFGASGSFFPSGLLQWILFAILILLIVIFVRKILGADEKYHAIPLKHD